MGMSFGTVEQAAKNAEQIAMIKIDLNVLRFIIQ